MTKEIESAMQSEIEQLPWMGPATKKRALEKLHAIANKIGYPDHWRDYSSIKILRDDYYGNVESATTFESRRDLAKIGKPLDRTEWQMTPPTVNAYYDAQMNDINFPAGVLQPPLYDPKIGRRPQLRQHRRHHRPRAHSRLRRRRPPVRRQRKFERLVDHAGRPGIRQARRLRLRRILAPSL